MCLGWAWVHSNQTHVITLVLDPWQLSSMFRSLWQLEAALLIGNSICHLAIWDQSPVYQYSSNLCRLIFPLHRLSWVAGPFNRGYRKKFISWFQPLIWDDYTCCNFIPKLRTWKHVTCKGTRNLHYFSINQSEKRAGVVVKQKESHQTSCENLVRALIDTKHVGLTRFLCNMCSMGPDPGRV